MKSKKILIIIVLTLSTLAFGMTDQGKFNALLKDYVNNPSAERALAVVNNYNRLLHSVGSPTLSTMLAVHRLDIKDLQNKAAEQRYTRKILSPAEKERLKEELIRKGKEAAEQADKVISEINKKAKSVADKMNADEKIIADLAQEAENCSIEAQNIWNKVKDSIDLAAIDSAKNRAEKAAANARKAAESARNKARELKNYNGITHAFAAESSAREAENYAERIAQLAL